MTTELTTEELTARVAEARENLEAAEARCRAKAERGEDPTPLDLAHLKTTQDAYYYGVGLLNARG